MDWAAAIKATLAVVATAIIIALFGLLIWATYVWTWRAFLGLFGGFGVIALWCAHYNDAHKQHIRERRADKEPRP
jgi:uncharacterized membrane protein